MHFWYPCKYLDSRANTKINGPPIMVLWLSRVWLFHPSHIWVGIHLALKLKMTNILEFHEKWLVLFWAQFKPAPLPLSLGGLMHELFSCQASHCLSSSSWFSLTLVTSFHSTHFLSFPQCVVNSLSTHSPASVTEAPSQTDSLAG